MMANYTCYIDRRAQFLAGTPSLELVRFNSSDLTGKEYVRRFLYLSSQSAAHYREHHTFYQQMGGNYVEN